MKNVIAVNMNMTDEEYDRWRIWQRKIITDEEYERWRILQIKKMTD